MTREPTMDDKPGRRFIVSSALSMLGFLAIQVAYAMTQFYTTDSYDSLSSAIFEYGDMAAVGVFFLFAFLVVASGVSDKLVEGWFGFGVVLWIFGGFKAIGHYVFGHGEFEPMMLVFIFISFLIVGKSVEMMSDEFRPE